MGAQKVQVYDNLVLSSSGCHRSQMLLNDPPENRHSRLFPDSQRWHFDSFLKASCKVRVLQVQGTSCVMGLDKMSTVIDSCVLSSQTVKLNSYSNGAKFEWLETTT